MAAREPRSGQRKRRPRRPALEKELNAAAEPGKLHPPDPRKLREDLNPELSDDDDAVRGAPLVPALARRVMEVAQEQQEELEEEVAEEAEKEALGAARLGGAFGKVERRKRGIAGGDAAWGRRVSARRGGGAGGEERKAVADRRAQLERDEDDMAGAKRGSRGGMAADGDDDDGEGDALGDELEGGLEEIELSPEDARALELLMPSEPPQRRRLSDLISEQLQLRGDGAAAALRARTDPKVLEVYSQLGRFLELYRGGKVPKALRIVPQLQNWEEIVFLMRPERWTAQAACVVARAFVYGSNVKLAQRYLNLVLLPQVMDNIQQHKKLNFHLYQALKKALFRPAAFFKGVLLPVAENGCTLREAVILSSVLARCSIPMLHSAAALLKMAEMPHTGASCLFIRALIDKKYSLPQRVVGALVHYFHSFVADAPPLPVVWHQSLLILVQRYGAELALAQRELLKELLRTHFHHLISQETRKLLLSLADPRPARPSLLPPRGGAAAMDSRADEAEGSDDYGGDDD